jgi:hypothetical protein
MFKSYEPGARCRIRYEGRSIEGEITERRGIWYRFRYRDGRGVERTGKVSSSQIVGRVFPAPRGERSITRGEWYRFEHEGKELTGVVYGIQDERYTLFYLTGNTAKAVVLSHDEIGTKEEGMTAVFQEEMARNPHYLEQWVATLTNATPWQVR